MSQYGTSSGTEAAESLSQQQQNLMNLASNVAEQAARAVVESTPLGFNQSAQQGAFPGQTLPQAQDQPTEQITPTGQVLPQTQQAQQFTPTGQVLPQTQQAQQYIPTGQVLPQTQQAQQYIPTGQVLPQTQQTQPYIPTGQVLPQTQQAQQALAQQAQEAQAQHSDQQSQQGQTASPSFSQQATSPQLSALQQQAFQAEAQQQYSPAVDVIESNDEVQVFADLPGVDSDSIEIQASNNTISLSAERIKSQQEDEQGNPVMAERGRVMQRQIQLPVNCNVDEASASWDKGVVTITLPKVEAESTKRIGVE